MNKLFRCINGFDLVCDHVIGITTSENKDGTSDYRCVICGYRSVRGDGLYVPKKYTTTIIKTNETVISFILGLGYE